MKVMRFYYHFEWFCTDFEGFSIISEGSQWIWAGRAMKMEDFQKKIEKKWEKNLKIFRFFFQKKIYVIFWFPVKFWVKNFFFLARILTVIFRPVLAQKILMRFQRGAGFRWKINENQWKSMKNQWKSAEINKNQYKTAVFRIHSVRNVDFDEIHTFL